METRSAEEPKKMLMPRPSDSHTSSCTRGAISFAIADCEKSNKGEDGQHNGNA